MQTITLRKPNKSESKNLNLFTEEHLTNIFKHSKC